MPKRTLTWPMLLMGAVKNVANGIPGYSEWRRINVNERDGIHDLTRLNEQVTAVQAELSSEDILHKRVLEIGPGETFGLGLYMLFCGAGAHMSIEKSRKWLSDEANREWHKKVFAEALAGAWGTDAANRASLIDCFSMFDRQEWPAGLDARWGAAEALPLEDEVVDLAYSFCVLEHVGDMRACLSELFRVTTKGGRGLHWIDLRSHHDPERHLDLLKYSDFAWRMVGSNREGFPNRIRAYQYLELAKTLGWDAQVELLSTASEQRIEQEKPHYASRFRVMSVKELTPLDILLRLKKPE